MERFDLDFNESLAEFNPSYVMLISMNSNELFDLWNIEKQRIENNEAQVIAFPQIKEVWLAVVGKNIGFEQNGGVDFSRPILVVKKFNNQMFWAVPLTAQQKSLDFYYNFADPSGKKVATILGQMRLISVKRCIRKIYTLQDANFECIINKLHSLLRY